MGSLRIVFLLVALQWSGYGDNVNEENHSRSPQNLIFKAKELSDKKGGNFRFIVSLEDDYKQNLATIESLEIESISRRILLPSLSMAVIEVDRAAKISDATNAVRAIQTIPGAEVDVDDVVYLFSELEVHPIRDHHNLLRGGGGRTPKDPLWVDSWGLGDIDAPEAWKLLPEKLYRPKVVIIGTGVNYQHPDVSKNMWKNPAGAKKDTQSNVMRNSYSDDVHGWNAVDKNGDPQDTNGLGTHLAGIIAALPDNDVGTTGVVWDATIIPCKFVNANGWGYLSDAIECIDYSIVVGADIILNAWGSDTAGSIVFHHAIKKALQANIVFVTPAGTQGRDITDEPHYPASYNEPNVVAVAAVSSSNKLIRDSNYSKRSVHLAAPGEGVKSISSKGAKLYSMGDGATTAAAYVAGVAALVKAADPTATCEEVVEALSNTKEFIDSTNVVAWNGKLDAYSAVKSILNQKEKEL